MTAQERADLLLAAEIVRYDADTRKPTKDRLVALLERLAREDDAQ